MLTPMIPKKGQKQNFSKNWYHHRNFHTKIYSMPIVRFWLLFLGRFAIFYPFLTPIFNPMTPKKDQKQKIITNWYHHRISRIKKLLYVDFQDLIAISRTICHFDPFLTPNFDPCDHEKVLKTKFYQNMILCRRTSLY